MKYFGMDEKDFDLLVYGVPQYLIDYVEKLKKIYPEVKIHIPAHEKALKIHKDKYHINYSPRYCVINLPSNFDFDNEYYKYLKSNYNNVI